MTWRHVRTEEDARRVSTRGVGAPRVMALLSIGLGLAVLAALPRSGLAARPALSGSGGQDRSSTPASLVRFPRMVGASDPVVRPHHWNERSLLLGPSAVAPMDVITNNWTNVFPIFYDVSAASSTEAWAAGEYGHLAHYADGSWTSVDPPSMRGLSLTGIKMLSANRGWVAGGARVFRYDGAAWSDMSNGLGTALFVGRVFPLADNNVWGVGTRCSGGCHDTVVHWDGSIWSSTGPTFSNSTFFTDIAMASDTDGWVVASDYNSNTSVVLRYDGTNWTQISGPPGATTLLRVSAPAPNEAWMISGYNNSVHHIYRYSGGTWTTFPVPGNYEAYGIDMPNSSEGYISTGYSIASWNGSAWTTEYTGRWLYDVSAVSGRPGRSAAPRRF